MGSNEGKVVDVLREDWCTIERGDTLLWTLLCRPKDSMYCRKVGCPLRSRNEHITATFVGRWKWSVT